MSKKLLIEPYPEAIGLVCFNDGQYEIDAFSPDIAPNQMYRRSDVVDAELAALREENERLRQLMQLVYERVRYMPSRNITTIG